MQTPQAESKPSEFIRTIDARDFESFGDLMAQLMIGEIALPVWIRTGKSTHKVTPETRDAVCRGLLIALNMQEWKER